MTAEMIQMEPMTKVFKHWQNLAIGAVLLALNVYLVNSATSMISDTTTAIQGWAVLIVAGYAFIAALYLATSAISDHSPLPQVLPGILNHAKLFIVGSVLYAIGAFLLASGAILPTNQIIAQVFALIVGAGLVLVSAIVAISTALTKLTK
jgi:MFS family permease